MTKPGLAPQHTKLGDATTGLSISNSFQIMLVVHGSQHERDNHSMISLHGKKGARFTVNNATSRHRLCLKILIDHWTGMRV